MRKQLAEKLRYLEVVLGKNTSYKRKNRRQKCCFYLRGLLLLVPSFLCGNVLVSFFHVKGFLGVAVGLFFLGLGALVPVSIKKYAALLREL